MRSVGEAMKGKLRPDCVNATQPVMRDVSRLERWRPSQVSALLAGSE